MRAPDCRPPAGAVPILAEDDAIIIVNKPAGLLSVPGKGPDKADCVLTRLRQERWDALLVHRLDCATSGVMVFARTRRVQAFLGREFEARRVAKSYVARVAGRVRGDAGRVELPLGADWPRRPRQMVSENGRAAITDWQVISRARDETRLRLMPLTGRSHQLRVHMLALGHPILGDGLYAPETLLTHPRLMLHAHVIGFRHPDTGRRVAYHAELPF